MMEMLAAPIQTVLVWLMAMRSSVRLRPAAWGEQLYAVVFKQPIETRTKTGKLKEKWGARFPRPSTRRRQQRRNCRTICRKASRMGGK